MKIVINGCYGGFSLSPEATLECYRLGMEGIARPVDEYFSHSDKTKDLEEWREYLKEPTDSLFITIFSPDERFVLDTRPEKRDDPILIQVVERLGDKANGMCAKLKVVEIPDGVAWGIDEYDGAESIEESHQSWS